MLGSEPNKDLWRGAMWPEECERDSMRNGSTFVVKLSIEIVNFLSIQEIRESWKVGGGSFRGRT